MSCIIFKQQHPQTHCAQDVGRLAPSRPIIASMEASGAGSAGRGARHVVVIVKRALEALVSSAESINEGACTSKGQHRMSG